MVSACPVRRVVIPGPADIAEIFGLRLLLEVPAARRAARQGPAGLVAQLRAELAQMRTAALAHDETRFMQHDQCLHRLIVNAAGNSRMVTLVDSLRDVTRILGASTAGRSRGLDAIADEHEPVIDAIAAGDAGAAGEAMERHITQTGKLLVAQAAISRAVTGRSGHRD